MNASARSDASILHVDMDAFFVAVELRDRPELVGKAAAVSQGGDRSVISSASYEARQFGVRSAMPAARARQLCPQLVFIPPNFDKYSAASRDVMTILHEFTPLVEQLSIDEAFLDVIGSVKLFGTPVEIAQQIRTAIRERLGLPASIGLATTKHVAKLASQRAKPDGYLEVRPEQTINFLHALPVEAIWGVGAATARTLKSRAIHTVADLAAEPIEHLRQLIGVANATRLHQLANGEDSREVVAERIEKSIGHEETFAVDRSDRAGLEAEILRLATRTAERLRERKISARTIAIKVRYSNFETVTRSRTLNEPTSATRRIYLTARELFSELAGSSDSEFVPAVRLIGVRAEQLSRESADLTALWSEDEEWQALDETVDRVAERFGPAVLTSARLLGPRRDVVDPRSLRPPL